MKHIALSVVAAVTVITFPGAVVGSVTSAPAAPNARAVLDSRLGSFGNGEIEHYFATPAATSERLEKEAMEFLYAYMPLPDVINYSLSFYRDNVALALRAREEMPWGDSVPDREFRHFVLPLRVNNEDLDDSRGVFYGELKERVAGLSMKEAILEVNHWCHEKATYRPSDGRTSSPLSTVSQAIGRCGEESTFAVAALRSVGIPARQVYTPRWAHTDDNHAWVEAWADGRWWFLGACEPEPILNLAWFNSPASRGMMMTTKAYGDYDGPEEVISRTPVNTTINVTANYAPVRPVEVVVTGADGKPVAGAKVLFSLYNYAEYYPIASKKADADGKASLVAGDGDMVVWATDGNRFGLAKAAASMVQPVRIVLDKGPRCQGSVEFDLVPPRQSASLPRPTALQSAINERRKVYEDSVRTAYTSTFVTEEGARTFAEKIDADADTMVKILTESRGNHSKIESLLSGLAPADRDKAMAVLVSVSEKDRRDIPLEVVTDRLCVPQVDTPLYNDYILNPRVENEGLATFAAGFLGDIEAGDVERYRANPQLWTAWVGDNILIDNKWNPGALRIHPSGVWRARVADPLSRDIFFVASSRAMGIPSRKDPVTGKAQWHNGKEWIDADFGAGSGMAGEPGAAPSGTVNLVFDKTGRITDPRYYYQFSISRIENGVARLLDFDEACTVNQLNDGLNRLDIGQYILTTGQRMADGSVLARSSFFNIDEGKTTDVPLLLRQDDKGLQVIGSLNAEHRYSGAGGDVQSLLSETGRGYYTLVYGKPNHEPTSHVLNDISDQADKFEADGRKIMLLYADREQFVRAKPEQFTRLPRNVTAGADIAGAVLAELVESLHLDEGELPVVVVADTFNRVVFVSQGYIIGIGDKLLDVLHRVGD